MPNILAPAYAALTANADALGPAFTVTASIDHADEGPRPYVDVMAWANEGAADIATWLGLDRTPCDDYGTVYRSGVNRAYAGEMTSPDDPTPIPVRLLVCYHPGETPEEEA